ncbi:diacylglycerol kinase [Ferrovum sp.]|uniref:diacylglycerol kinase n=1 Tax=Ferrovum sp. TaxID=2609467 RepID=UPI00260E1638|nr:diacylglycerol kinase [Ferrovum sp.]
MSLKNLPLHERMRHALHGIGTAWQEASFRTELLAAVIAEGTLVWLKPPMIWDALITLMVALVLSAELFNTALERTLDGLHPQQAPFVKQAKDLAAGAVLILSLTSLILYGMMWGEMGWLQG